MIQLHGLTKCFGTKKAVSDLRFSIPAGQIVGLLGPNGAGKSTTLKMLTGLLAPTSGSATLCGFDLLTQSLDIKRHVGFVPDSAAVFETLSGLEYLELIAALYEIPQSTAKTRIEQFLNFFDLDLESLHGKLLGAYSKGMQRKIAITAGLLHNPQVVFFDEPLDGLDANSALGFKTLIQHLAKEGRTILYSSHVLDVVERVCDRVIIIDEGCLLLDGEPETLIKDRGAATLESLFTELTGGSEMQARAEAFAKTLTEAK